MDERPEGAPDAAAPEGAAGGTEQGGSGPESLTPGPAPSPRAKKAKTPSRADRWMEAATEAVAALEGLLEVQEEYKEWLDNLPENLRGSATGELLEEIANLDLDSALGTAQEAEGVTLPQGFGRD